MGVGRREVLAHSGVEAREEQEPGHQEDQLGEHGRPLADAPEEREHSAVALHAVTLAEGVLRRAVFGYQTVVRFKASRLSAVSAIVVSIGRGDQPSTRWAFSEVAS
ncbi:hypothetical protein Amsp01_059270 [Amycolatopsis sp. NBRC 101858]|nr:hypothetical protein Amsp01_059270 [Amycolatopsis sp. NBRC 101858]